MMVMTLVLTASRAQAVPLRFSVQGILRAADGSALASQSMPVIVRFFDAQTGGNQLGKDLSGGAVPAVNGLFTVALDAPSILTDLASTSSVWMEPNLNGEIYSRQQVTSEIFALMCSKADSVDWSGVATSVTPTTEWPGSVQWSRIIGQPDVVTSDAGPPNESNGNKQTPLISAVKVALSQGRWLVTGHASLSTTDVDDVKYLALYSEDQRSEIPGSRSGLGAGNLGTNGSLPGIPLPFMTSAVIDIPASGDTIHLYAKQNGQSTLLMGNPTASVVVLSSASRIYAVRLK
jgi:hypothetical protein